MSKEQDATSWIECKPSPDEIEAKRIKAMHEKYSGSKRTSITELAKTYPNLTRMGNGFVALTLHGSTTERITFSPDGLELDRITYTGTEVPDPTDHGKILHRTTHTYDADGYIIEETDIGVGAQPHIAIFTHVDLADGRRVLATRTLQVYRKQGFLDFGPLDSIHVDTFEEFHEVVPPPLA
jgi:hypothetical protein